MCVWGEDVGGGYRQNGLSSWHSNGCCKLTQHSRLTHRILKSKGEKTGRSLEKIGKYTIL